MPTPDVLLRGTDAPSTDRIQLRAGPLTAVFEPQIGFLRYIKLGDQEILRGLYSAVRDHNWDTIAAKITNLNTEVGDRSFRITFDCAHVERDIDFRWQATVEGDTSGTISFEMDGQAHSDFRRNRIGFCVLHSPAYVAGKPCTVEKDDGSVEEGRFPDAISPHQPFVDMRAIRHEVVQGVTAEVRLEGDVFEMEDQRNWTDASYKTYCTPLEIPFPVDVESGSAIQQKVTIRLVGDVADSGDDDGASVVSLTVTPSDGISLPELGLSLASHDTPLSESHVRGLETMHLHHLRADLRLSEAAWEAVLDRADLEAASLGLQLELACTVSDAAAAELKALAEKIDGLATGVCRVLIYHVAEAVAERKWIELAREHVEDIPIVSGTNAYFTELNRNRPDMDVLDGICYSLNPQVHAFDDASLMETLIAQGWTVDSTRTFAGTLPVHVSPVTLSPRFNPNATVPESDADSGTLPSSVDVRQMSLFGAAWLVGSLKYLTQSGAASVTYFETTGWKGVLETEGGSPEPFRAEPDSVFPMAHVMTWFGGMRGGTMLRSDSTDHLRVDGLAVRKDAWVRILVANTTDVPQEARVLCPGLEGSVRVEVLDGETVKLATTEPRSFRSRKDIQNAETIGGTVSLVLAPYAVVCIKGKLAG